MPPPPRGRPHSGFTVVELLVAAAIAAMVILALASSLQVFGKNIEAVRADSDSGPHEVVALMTDMARYGWSIEQPGDHQLDVVDALGGRTSFALDDSGQLRITRPSGAHGTLLGHVEDFSIHTDSVRRLREANPIFENRAWWEKPGPVFEELTVETGLPIAMGFTMDSAVPDEFDPIADIDEHALSAYLSTMVVPIAYLPAIPPDPNEPIIGDGNENNGNGNKVEICHIPPGNPANAHTLSVSINAVDAHLAHGDILGACSAPPPPEPEALLVFELYEARAPDDARPVGPMLASTTISSYSLPYGSAMWVESDPGEHGDEHNHNMDECGNTTPDGKVVICHVPPGNPSNAHSITISPNAVPAHLAHGDYYGCCGQHETQDTIYTLVINVPTAETALDLSPLGEAVLPGRAYTLVTSLQGPGSVHFGAFDGGSIVNTGVAQSADVGGDLVAAGLQIPFRLEGPQQITQTEEHAPISQLSLSLEMENGQHVSGSSSVLGQAGVPGEWLGVVPGQQLELSP